MSTVLVLPRKIIGLGSIAAVWVICHCVSSSADTLAPATPAATTSAPAPPAASTSAPATLPTAVHRPIYEPVEHGERLNADCAPLLAMSVDALAALVPPQAGFWFGGCPDPALRKAARAHDIIWSPELGDHVKCAGGDELFPNAQYPENRAIDLTTPTGKIQIWKYYLAPDGSRYWMEARRWYEQRVYTEHAAYLLAQLYAETGNAQAGRRAAAILNRFARVYPDYILHTDLPFQPKQFFLDGFPRDEPPYRVAKWSWWAYLDISLPLLKAYDLLAAGDLLSPDQRSHIENDLFRGMLAFVANDDGAPLTNMHPGLWTDEAAAAAVLGDRELAAKVGAQARLFETDLFTYDDFWKEGTPSYHLQTANSLFALARVLHPEQNLPATQARVSDSDPALQGIMDAANRLRLPDGRYVALHDTWAAQAPIEPIDASTPQLLPGLGYAILGMGGGADQFQAHLNFTGRFGHSHDDSLGIVLYGDGQELASDLGYTHSRARPWAVTTAAHSTVVIDQTNQVDGEAPYNALGTLEAFDAADPDLQFVQAQAPNAYPGLATTYRRSLVAVGAGIQHYVLDVFDVAGGSWHDWLLHGSADLDQGLTLCDASGRPLKLAAHALLPAGFEFVQSRNEDDTRLSVQPHWAFGNFRDPQAATTESTVVATFSDRAKPAVGLTSWILGEPGTRYTATRAWAIRNLGLPFQEDESKLDQRMRQTVIVGRAGPANRFVALHCPFTGTPTVRRVTRLAFEPGGVALKIERDGGVDYLLWGPDAAPRTGHDGDLSFAFDGRVALARQNGASYDLKMIDGSSLAFGTQTLRATPQPPAALLAVDGNRFTVAGVLPLHVGDVFIIRHGNGRTTAFHVAQVAPAGPNTAVVTTERPAFAGAADGVLKLTRFPGTQFPAPHQVLVDTLTKGGT